MKSNLSLLVVALVASTPALSFEASRNLEDPHGFDRQPLVSRVSRAQVHAETLAALAAGQVARGEAATPALMFRSVKTRAQVAAETLEAARLGLLTWSGENAPPRPTPHQEEQIRRAGLRALAGDVASK